MIDSIAHRVRPLLAIAVSFGLLPGCANEENRDTDRGAPVEVPRLNGRWQLESLHDDGWRMRLSQRCEYRFEDSVFKVFVERNEGFVLTATWRYRLKGGAAPSTCAECQTTRVKK